MNVWTKGFRNTILHTAEGGGVFTLSGYFDGTPMDFSCDPAQHHGSIMAFHAITRDHTESHGTSHGNPVNSLIRINHWTLHTHQSKHDTALRIRCTSQNAGAVNISLLHCSTRRTPSMVERVQDVTDSRYVWCMRWLDTGLRRSRISSAGFPIMLWGILFLTDVVRLGVNDLSGSVG